MLTLIPGAKGPVVSPQMIAQLYDRSVAAELRGDPVAAMTSWWDHYWLPEGPPEPPTLPDAVSFLSRNPQERGPRWYAVDGAILGYLAETAGGCYRVPMDATVPAFAGLTISAPEQRETSQP